MNGDRGGSLSDRILESPITWLITAINLGVFIIAWTKGEHIGQALTSETLRAHGAIRRDLVWNGEYWRLLSAMFLHVGVVHLLWNNWVMFGWSANVERTAGSGWFAFAYLTTGTGACAISVIGHVATSAGASGAGFGMVSLTLAMLYRRAGSWDAFISSPFVRHVLRMTALWIVIGFLGVRMDNYAHVGGFVLGIPCGLLLEQRRGSKRKLWFAGLAAYILVWVGIVVTACVPGLGFSVSRFQP